MGSYDPLVDIIGHEDIGGKTILYIIDGLYGGDSYGATPIRWTSEPFNNDWPSSIFASQDPVAIDSVGLDFLRAEWPLKDNADNYLHEAAMANDPCSGTFYDPEGDGSQLSSLGVHEHWNSPMFKQYSRNLGTGNGIELWQGPVMSIVDFSGDGRVDFKDFSILAQYWRLPELSVDVAPPLFGDGVVDFKDVAFLVEDWLTATTIPPLPGPASNPHPSNGAGDVDINADLSWTAGADATSHDVYFGTSGPPPFICNQTATTFDPCTMAYNTTYYWRVDAVNMWGTTTGTVWSFTTIALEATNPNPADGATKVSTTADLSWTAGADATSHNVYFGTSSAPPFIRNQTATTFDPGTMSTGTTYYWRIDEVGAHGTITGTVWSFTTAGPPH